MFYTNLNPVIWKKLAYHLRIVLDDMTGTHPMSSPVLAVHFWLVKVDQLAGSNQTHLLHYPMHAAVALTLTPMGLVSGAGDEHPVSFWLWLSWPTHFCSTIYLSYWRFPLYILTNSPLFTLLFYLSYLLSVLIFLLSSFSIVPSLVSLLGGLL